jgi:hypothetical protein
VNCAASPVAEAPDPPSRTLWRRTFTKKARQNTHKLSLIVLCADGNKQDRISWLLIVLSGRYVLDLRVIKDIAVAEKKVRLQYLYLVALNATLAEDT